MLKKISLRARLTLLSAMVMASVAVMLTGMFLVGADRIFVRSLQQYFVTQSEAITCPAVWNIRTGRMKLDSLQVPLII